ncbi:MAG TPA: retroviral-like aspartic protease family protein [Thermoplasmata archaeon]|nr:retroviral-like aspartic protease family protein [Thermoplasmata archaeon]
MGLTHVEVTLFGASGEGFTMTLLVDSGATYTVVPRELAERLGLRPEEELRFEIANGEIVTRPVGQAEVQIQGRRTWTKIVFGEPRDKKLLGVYTLEGLGLEIDPVRRLLRPVSSHSLMAQAAA